MSDRCKDDVGTDDARWMSRVSYVRELGSWFYSVGGVATEVFQDKKGRRRNGAVSWRVGISEVTCDGGSDSSWRTGSLGLLRKGDSRSRKAIKDMIAFDRNEEEIDERDLQM